MHLLTLNHKQYLPVLLLLLFTIPIYAQNPINSEEKQLQDASSFCDSLDINLLIPTFLGNSERNYYGNTAPDALDIVWEFYLGKGITVISRRIGEKEWEGAGWTGQPLLVEEAGRKYLIQGSFDHNLYKLDAETAKVIWKYQFDDVIKGTGTIWNNCKTGDLNEAYVILQGSRLGVGKFLDYNYIPSYRAISLITGEELWRHNVKWTDSYSRDVDASALIINDTAYIGLENSLFTVFDPDPRAAAMKDGMFQPHIYQQRLLYEKKDVLPHKHNVVTEASPCLLNNRIYIASGSGHIWGYNLLTRELDWDFFIGSDIDGTPVVTSDSCIIVPIEKQYIKGQGGAIKLDPARDPQSAVNWYFPVGDHKFSSWEGGIIGSPTVNDTYAGDSLPCMAAFSAIDGYLYVVKHKITVKDSVVLGPDSMTVYNTPELVFKYRIGSSISTPIFVENKIIAAGYDGIFLFSYSNESGFKLLDRFTAPFEASPIAYNKRIYIASRNGYLYCFGDK